jgi:Uma2 family endonuclease
MKTTRKPPTTPGEYLLRERRAEYKTEYYSDELRAMTGASRAHNRIVFRLAAMLEPVLRARGCEGYAGDMRVRVERTGAYVYPDVVVACGEPRFEDAELDTLLNPTVVIEVLSRTTEDYDRGRKWEHYRRIPSLRHYVLISQERPRMEVDTLQDSGLWRHVLIEGMEAEVTLEEIGFTFHLAELYQGLLPEPPTTERREANG